MTVVTRIEHKAQMQFPLTFPLRFDKINFTESAGLTAGMTAAASISGAIKSIIPVSGSFATTTTMTAAEKSNASLAAPGLSAVAAIVAPTAKLGASVAGALTAAAAASGTVADTITASGTMQATSTCSAQAALGAGMSAEMQAEETGSGNAGLSAALAAGLTASGIMTAQMQASMAVTAAGLQAEATVSGIVTAIFTGYTNIVANGAIAGAAQLAAALVGELEAETDACGAVQSLISGAMEAEASILFPQVFRFPMTFPLIFDPGLHNDAAISAEMNAEARIANIGIAELLSAAMNAESAISGTLTCTIEAEGFVAVTTAVTATVQNHAQVSGAMIPEAVIPAAGVQLQAACSAGISAAAEIKSTSINVGMAGSLEALTAGSAQAALGCAESAQGTAAVQITAQIASGAELSPQVVSDGTVISGSVLAALETGTSLAVESDLTGNFQVADMLAGNLEAITQASGAVQNLISGSLKASGSISLPQVFRFPLTFPLLFDPGIHNDGTLSPEALTEATEIAAANIVQNCSANMRVQSAISGTVRIDAALQGAIVATAFIAVRDADSESLSGNLEACAQISASLSKTAALAGHCGAAAILSAADAVSMRLEGQLSPGVVISARISRETSIELPGIFQTGVSVAVQARFSQAAGVVMAGAHGNAVFQAAVSDAGTMQIESAEKVLFRAQEKTEVSVAFGTEGEAKFLGAAETVYLITVVHSQTVITAARADAVFASATENVKI